MIAPAFGAVYAFTDWSGLGDLSFIGLANFAEIFASPAERTALVNTLQLAVVFVVLVNATGLVLAVALYRTFRPSHALRSLFFLPAVMIPLSVSQVWRFVLDYNGPLNGVLRVVGLDQLTRNWLGDVDFALWMVLLVMLWQYTGYAMVIYIAGLASISPDIYEAGAIDGASPWQRFRFLTLPLLAPSVTIAAVLMTITGLGTFDQILGLTGGGPAGATNTLASSYYQQTWVNGRYGYGTALALLLTTLVVVVGLAQAAVLRRQEERIDA